MIEDYFLGHWNNRTQCSMYPTEYSNIHILWEQIDGGFRSRQWKHRDPIENAYKDLYHKFVQDGSNYILESYDHAWTKRQGCDILLRSTTNGWSGSNTGSCYHHDMLIQTNMEITKDKYKIFDYATRNGEFAFGGNKFFEFVRIG